MGTAKYVFTYGDSYTSTGFDMGGTKPTADNPLGNPSYPGVTSTGPSQENWVDIFTMNSPRNTLTYDLAVSGSSIDQSLLQGFSKDLQHFVNTSALWAANVNLQPTTGQWSANNSVHVIWFGRNDVYWQIIQRVPMQTRLDAVLASYINSLTTLWDAGARRFVIMDIAPMWYEPMWHQQKEPFISWLPLVSQSCAYWSQQLASLVGAWSAGKIGAGLQLTILNTQSAFERVINDPTSWGLYSSTCRNDDADVNSGGRCPFADLIHPGPPIARSIAIAVGRHLVDTGFLSAFAMT